MERNEQMPATVNQIKEEKPNAPRVITGLIGNLAVSFNGGHHRTIAYKKVMAGEKHIAYRLQGNIQLLTPLTPAWQKLKMEIQTFFVPDVRVWTNAEKFYAQKGGTSEEKIAEIPNFKDQTIAGIIDSTNSSINLQDSTVWRDRWVSSYIPRFSSFNRKDNADEETEWIQLPKVSALPLRGMVAIYNDFLRNKEYDREEPEYKGDTVSYAESESYFRPEIRNLNFEEMRCKKNNSYYSDYRTDVQGFETMEPSLADPFSNLNSWIQFENLMDAARTQANDAQKNDWDIIAELGGTKPATQGKVQLIGRKVIPLNYSAITQSTYNTNSEIEEEFTVMGKQGAYSYTEIDLPIYTGFEAIEHGHIHVIVNVTADTVYESAFERTMLNCNALDQYRPDLSAEKFDVMYEIEQGAVNKNMNNYAVYGFKRKWSELFKLPNVIQGDMTTNPHYDYRANQSGGVTFNGSDTVLSQKTYQFFELGADKTAWRAPDGRFMLQNKNVWQDYTDLQINNNLAIREEIEYIPAANGTTNHQFHVMGQNQIIMVGKTELVANLPVDEAIKNNFTKWGEH